jgi:hypothetical protein
LLSTKSGVNYAALSDTAYIRMKGSTNTGGVAAGHHPWGRNWPSIDKDPGPKGLFLNSTLVSQISYTGPKTDLEVHFLEKEQEWFFLKPF